MRVLVAENDPLILDALKQVLPQLAPDTEVVLARHRASVEWALDEDQRFELLLLDLALPGASGQDFVAKLKQRYPGMWIVVLSEPHDDETNNTAIAVGAHDFFSKTYSINSLLRALRVVFLEKKVFAKEFGGR